MSTRLNTSLNRKKFSHVRIAVATVLVAASGHVRAQAGGSLPTSPPATWTITISQVKDDNGILVPSYQYEKDKSNNCTDYKPPADQPGGPNHIKDDPLLNVCPGDTIIWQYEQNDYPVTVIISQKGHNTPPSTTGNVWGWQGRQNRRVTITTPANADAISYKYSLAVFDLNGNLVLTDDPEIKIGGGHVPNLPKLINSLQGECKCKTRACPGLWQQLIRDLKADGLY